METLEVPKFFHDFFSFILPYIHKFSFAFLFFNDQLI